MMKIITTMRMAKPAISPVRRHGPAGLRPGLALPQDARHSDDHDHGDDDDQNDKEHGPLLPAAPG
jgi:hypothetical protein